MDEDLSSEEVREQVAETAELVGEAWPLHSFVTANPLAGFEDRPFHEAVRVGERIYGGRGYPDPSSYRRAWREGRIEPEVLEEELESVGEGVDAETSLDSMLEQEEEFEPAAVTSDDRLDGLVADWLSAFCDEGRAEAPMPHRDRGFYRAWRRLARHQPALPDAAEVEGLPKTPEKMVAAALEDVPEGRRRHVLFHHLAALPGWTAYVRRRAEDQAEWQEAHPVDPTRLLAVRFGVADLLDVEVAPDEDPLPDLEDAEPPVEEAWLAAWERSQRDRLVEAVAEEAGRTERGGAPEEPADAVDTRPDAQLTFCIDTRSEVFRRHLEAQGDYETHGYAGFFGLPMRYDAADEQGTVDACPPIVDPAHHVEDRPAPEEGERAQRHDVWGSLVDTTYGLAETLETNVATAFSYVELAGVGYGAVMTALTLAPRRMRSAARRLGSSVPSRDACYAPRLDHAPEEGGDVPSGMALDDRVDYAETAFDLMGWDGFARLAVFVGHRSETSNNPFDSSLDCGACAGNPGGPNARVLATICNQEEVRDRLRERGVAVPDDTVFLAAEHNTTTDEVELFDSHVPPSHREDLEALESDLAAATEQAAVERVGGMPDADPEEATAEVATRAVDWAQTRPEWGLAGNAFFVIGPRSLTEGLDLSGRAFLHSYDWRSDPGGDSLEQILAGPAVVTQWINSQYYFATVDNEVWGSGSKVTQNPTGNLGVRQGNGGDLETGLPLQSIAYSDDESYHEPLRLSIVVHAPVERVTRALEEVEGLRELLDNGWLRLSVVDPADDDSVHHYEEGVSWCERGSETPPPSGPARGEAD